ncbi:UDP-N-acetylmuramoyl-tripeptide--D-alanyl-D-alanine ligase [Namhaeicola litoreus]|uniref:UDP-N-acetylmuramoyl-tripeptide--D-alanyl-D-alanine ligase n=1 Tax=Namhaeicola litoreus TaxID=1052145 RepID=A0ABW3Y705_9FLAO
MKLEQLYHLYSEHYKVETDTRKDLKNAIFFALKGDRFNGNLFAEKALAQGALYAVVDELEFAKNDKFILVDNVLETLQALARFHRRKLDLPIVAMTGSNGKTTSKELITAVLSKKFNCGATRGNLNNHIGVPLTLLSMTPKTEIGVVEMGANHPKEIDFLCRIAEPDFGYITNFGRVHLEGFINLAGVIQSKTEMYRELAARNKMVFVNANDEVQLERSKDQLRKTFGPQGSDYPISFIKADPFVVVEFNHMSVSSQLIGKYNFANICAAIAIGCYFKVEPFKIKEAIEAYIPQNNRSQIIQKGELKIILDAYNANPNSMVAALENLFQLGDNKKMVILGDMFEIGEKSHEEHQAITDLLQNSDLDKIILVGKNFAATNYDENKIVVYPTFDELKAGINKNEFLRGVVLVKASRGMALERVLELL